MPDVTMVELVGGKKCGQVDAPREAPSNLETPSAVVLFNISFALAIFNFKKSRKLIGEKHIYFNMFVTKAFIHHPPRNCSGAYCSADTPHGGQHAERGSLKVTKMEFFQKAHI